MKASSGHVRLVVANRSHAREIARIYEPSVSRSVISFEEVAPSAEEMGRRIEATLPTHPWLVAVSDGSPVGYGYAAAHNPRAAYRWSVNVSVYVAEEFRRRGIATRLYQELFRILREQGFRNAYAGITLPNAASVGIHESMGFRPVGVYEAVGYKFGAWHDVGWWQLALREKDSTPAEPVAYAEMGKGGE